MPYACRRLRSTPSRALRLTHPSYLVPASALPDLCPDTIALLSRARRVYTFAVVCQQARPMRPHCDALTVD